MEQQLSDTFPYYMDEKTLKNCSFHSTSLFEVFTFKNRSRKIFNSLRFCKPSECKSNNIDFGDYSISSRTIRNKRIFEHYSSFSEYNSDKLYVEYTTQKLNFASISTKYCRNRL